MTGKTVLLTTAVWILTQAVFTGGCGDGGRPADHKKQQEIISAQYLAVVVVLPDGIYTADKRGEKQLSLQRLIEENGIGRVVSSETRKEITEVVFQVTMEGEVRGILRGFLLEWDPSVSYMIEERQLGK